MPSWCVRHPATHQHAHPAADATAGAQDNLGSVWPDSSIVRDELTRAYGPAWMHSPPGIFVRERSFNPSRLQQMTDFKPFKDKQGAVPLRVAPQARSCG